MMRRCPLGGPASLGPPLRRPPRLAFASLTQQGALQP